MSAHDDGDDVLDAEQARRFAWRMEAPPDVTTRPEEAEPAATEPTPMEPAPARAAVDADLAPAIHALRSRIDRVWAMSPAKQPAATIALLGEAERLGLRIAALGADPHACVRLARLTTRHFGRLPKMERREHAHLLAYLTFAGPELGALLVEVARRGERELDWTIDRGVRSRAAWRAASDAVPHRARMLDEAPRWATRELCIRYLCAIGGRDAARAVRRALRLPHLRCRHLALRGLEPDKGELTEDDVRFLLEDALAHPLEESSDELHLEAFYQYPRSIARALAFVRPEGGHRPLEAILEGEGAVIRRERVGLDEGWALLALATGWPERAIRWTRRMSISGYARSSAVEAAALLSEPDARALLTEVASGADADLSDLARAAFLKRFGGELAIAPEDGLPLPFEGPPSEAALARLAVLRGASREAKAELARVLLAEAPDREAATLLLFLVGRSSSLYLLQGSDLPRGPEAWARLLVERFGAPALEGLARLAERDVAAGVVYGWMGRVLARGSAGAGPLLDDATKDRLRAAAVGAFASPGWRPKDDVLFALSQLGAPRALAPALFELAIEAQSADGLTPSFAIEALAKVEPDAELDARLLGAASEAVDARSWKRAERALSACWARELTGVRAVGERLLAELDRLPASAALESLAGAVAWRLHTQPLDEAWVEEALREPASLRFDVACGILGRRAPTSAIALLRAALASDARGGAAAAAAATRLVWVGELAATDPRVDSILRACPPRSAARLVGAVIEHRELADLAATVRRLLGCEDRDAAKDALESLWLHRPAGHEDLIAGALADGAVHPDFEESARFMAGEPSEAELYWQDAPDDDDW